MKMNLPNRLTTIRAILVPFFVFFMVYPVFGEDNILLSRAVSTAIFSLAALTDFLDGKIARKYGLITRFGKFMDPLADKFMVFAALFAISFSPFMLKGYGCVSDSVIKSMFMWMSLIIIFRELMVTSLRLVVSAGEQKIVIPANIWGKAKTVSQIFCVIFVITEPLYGFSGGVISFVFIIITAFFTVFSGATYIKAYWKYIDPSK